MGKQMISRTRTHRTNYDFVYRDESNKIVSRESYTEMGYPDGYWVAAVKEVWKGDRLISRDQAIDDSNWVDADLDNASELAIEKRNT